MELIAVLFSVSIMIIVLLAMTFLLKQIIWLISPIFAFSNRLQWAIYNPLKFVFKKGESETSRRLFLLLNYTLIAPIYWLVVHLYMTPLRLINALYYDVLLYWTVMLDDTLQELFIPKLGRYRYQKGYRYALLWIGGFPIRLTIFLLKVPATLLDSVLMTGISILLPTLTMYHGTKFDGPAANIVQQGRWYVGRGDYAGSGIYFAIQRSVANHYAPNGQQKGILLVRLTPTFTRNQTTLPLHSRNLIGRDGQQLSNKLSFPWYTIEHWRSDLKGWEYCLVQPNQAGRYIRSWRIRPIAVLRDEDNKLARIWGGFGHYSLNPVGILVGILSWLVLIAIVSSA